VLKASIRRWRQENFFTYLREEYALDALVDCGVEPSDPTRDVPNPIRAALDAELHKVKVELASLQATYGAAALPNREHSRPTMRGFKIANAGLGHQPSPPPATSKSLPIPSWSVSTP
jgi:hypothetical protein